MVYTSQVPVLDACDDQLHLDIYAFSLPQSLHAMEGHVMVNFLPTILNQLFCVLTRATQEDVAVNVTRRATHTRFATCA